MAGLSALGLVVLAWPGSPGRLGQGSGPPRAERPAWDAALHAARVVDVNTAPVAELERLPGIGPARAGEMVRDRTAHGPFKSVEDLARIRGIGPETLRALADRVRISE